MRSLRASTEPSAVSAFCLGRLDDGADRGLGVVAQRHEGTVAALVCWDLCRGQPSTVCVAIQVVLRANILVAVVLAELRIPGVGCN